MKPVMHALIKKRAEIAGRIEAIHAAAARLVAALELAHHGGFDGARHVQRRMNEGDLALRKVVQKRVYHALKRLETRKGVVVSPRAGAGALRAWRITKPDANLEGGWRNGSS